MLEHDNVSAGIRRYLHIEQDGQVCSSEWKNSRGLSENHYVDVLRFYAVDQDMPHFVKIFIDNTPILSMRRDQHKTVA